MTFHPTVILNAVKDLFPKSRNCRVGRGAQRRNPPQITMGFVEFILSLAEGLNPSYGGIAV